MKAALVVFLEFIKGIDFASIIASAISGLGGFWGTIASFIAKPFLKALQTQVDNKIDQVAQAEQSDTQIDQKAQANAQEMANAKTDSDFDNAARDSLK